MCHYVAAQTSFMTVKVADTHAHVQRLVSVVKVATMLQGYTTEEQRSVVRFLWAKYIHKEMFPVYGGKCLSRKAVLNWIEKFYQGSSKVTDDTRPVMEVAETVVQKTSVLPVSTHW
jgi:hypothetical protein